MKTLQSEKIVLGTTDTVPGLFASLTHTGFECLNALKGRTNKPYIVLVGSLQQAQEFCDVFTHNSVAKKLADTFWPGPLTLIVRAKKDMPEWLSHHGTIALRMPQHEGLLEVLQKVNGLFSTSANKSGEKVPLTVEDVDPEIMAQCAGIIKDRLERQNLIASTIVDCTGNVPKVVRQGSVVIDSNFLNS